MKISARFFAQFRDLVRTETIAVDLPEGSTVTALLENLYELEPALRAYDKNILVGAGVEFVDRNYELKPGDELAIMPPVQGG